MSKGYIFNNSLKVFAGKRYSISQPVRFENGNENTANTATSLPFVSEGSKEPDTKLGSDIGSDSERNGSDINREAWLTRWKELEQPLIPTKDGRIIDLGKYLNSSGFLDTEQLHRIRDVLWPESDGPQ